MICTASSLVSEKSYGWASRLSADPVPLEVRDQLLHRRVERVLGAQRVGSGRRRARRRSAHSSRGDLQQPLPVAHLGPALLLVRRRPVEHRHQREDLHPGLRGRPSSSRRSARRRPWGSGARRTSRPAARAPRTRSPGRRPCAARRPPTSRRGTCAGRARSSPWVTCPSRRSGPRRGLVEVGLLAQRHLDALAGLHGLQARVADDRGGVAVPRARPGRLALGGRVDPLLELGVVGPDEPLRQSSGTRPPYWPLALDDDRGWSRPARRCRSRRRPRRGCRRRTGC